jgi:hypothetical protein
MHTKHNLHIPLSQKAGGVKGQFHEKEFFCSYGYNFKLNLPPKSIIYVLNVLKTGWEKFLFAGERIRSASRALHRPWFYAASRRSFNTILRGRLHT